jgi:hypothetical protein
MELIIALVILFALAVLFLGNGADRRHSRDS